jgi:hypothetical protein
MEGRKNITRSERLESPSTPANDDRQERNKPGFCRTVKCAKYSDRVRNGLGTTRRGNLAEDALVLHDNASSHTVCCPSWKTLQEMISEVLDQPAWSADIAPSDFHLFGPPDRTVDGLPCADDDEVKEAGRE